VSAQMATAAGIPVIDSEDRKLAGVCAGIARHYGIDVKYVRIAFVLLTLLGGIGVALYGLAYLVMTSPETSDVGDPTAVVHEAAASWREGLGAGAIAGAVALIAGAGWQVVLPVGAGVTAGVIVMRSGIATTKRGRVGAALMIVGAVLVARALPAIGAVQSFAFPVIVVLAGSVMLFGPWWLRMAQALTAERTARIRAQERAEVAAHLHDSVLQTLALIQRRSDDPAEVAQLARRQERELRAWLNADETAAADTLHGALVRAAAEIEADHGVEVEVICVGDRPLDDDTRALAAAAREAILNAAKFAGAGRIDVYGEVSAERAEVFVRDRGAGFDPDAVPPDRRGVRESIVGRMQRHGGSAEVRSQPGGGTEVELSL
jgi:signal transduction histidine kinase/phage shock protein PspC (stress-responsive transcriptional regulator)